MSQKLMPDPTRQAVVEKPFENVNESWVLYDTILLGQYVSNLAYKTGYFGAFSQVGAVSFLPFFNVRNRNHGLSYNNQDTRDQLPYVMKIYSVGVSFFSPSTTLYRDNAGAPLGAQRTELDLWETEIPKHMSLTLTTNQDDRLKIGSLLAPPGYGIMTSGIASGDTETDLVYPPLAHSNFTQGLPELTNKWGFRKPLEVPRRANLSVRLDISEYGRELLKAMPGPYFQFFQSKAADGTYFFAGGMFGIQVTIGGVREVQQRDQYHA